MVLIDKLWDDVMAGPQPDKGLGMLRKSLTVQTGTPILYDSQNSKAYNIYVNPFVKLKTLFEPAGGGPIVYI